MKSIIAITAAVLFLAACSNKPPAGGDPLTGGSTGPGGTASGAPGSPGGGPSGAPGGGVPGDGGSGTAKDKAACAAITVKLSDWGLAFANAAAGLGTAGNDAAKIEVVVKDTKAANSKFAGELRAEAGKTSDAEVKKVATDLAGSLDKINSQLDPKKVAQDPNVLLAAFDLPEYAAAADAYEKVCAG